LLNTIVAPSSRSAEAPRCAFTPLSGPPRCEGSASVRGSAFAVVREVALCARGDCLVSTLCVYVAVSLLKLNASTIAQISSNLSSSGVARWQKMLLVKMSHSCTLALYICK
jgi:hypothetical protein